MVTPEAPGASGTRLGSCRFIGNVALSREVTASLLFVKNDVMKRSALRNLPRPSRALASSIIYASALPVSTDFGAAN